MELLRLLLLILGTALLGSLGIAVCLVVPGGSALMPVARLWSWLVMKNYRVRYRAEYAPGVPSSSACVFVANHQSQFEIPALVLALPVNFRMVAKRELLYIPIFGWALWLAGFVFIDRHDRGRAIRRLDRAARTLRRGISIVVFAEGTRSVDGRLLPFKKGAFVLALQAGVPIVPVSLSGGHDILPKGGLRVRPGTIEIRFGSPVDTSGYTFEARDALIARVRQAIAAGLQPPEAAPLTRDRGENPAG